MVTKVHPSGADFDNLSRLRTEMSSQANTYDYSGIVVPKPWGYEYLWRQNGQTAIWMLHLDPSCATSLHCHVFKRTSLIVLEGQVVCSTLEDRFRLDPADAVVLEAGVFHSSQAVSPGGAWVLEVESPPLKGDLARLRDGFGRTGQGYEAASGYTREVHNFDFTPFEGDEQRRGGVRLCVRDLHGAADVEEFSLLAPLTGHLPNRKGTPPYVGIGEAIDTSMWQGGDGVDAREVLLVGTCE